MPCLSRSPLATARTNSAVSPSTASTACPSPDDDGGVVAMERMGCGMEPLQLCAVGGGGAAAATAALGDCALRLEQCWCALSTTRCLKVHQQPSALNNRVDAACHDGSNPSMHLCKWCAWPFGGGNVRNSGQRNRMMIEASSLPWAGDGRLPYGAIQSHPHGSPMSTVAVFVPRHRARAKSNGGRGSNAARHLMATM